MAQKPTIFIIEDDYHIRHLVETILSENGYIASSAESAEIALKKLSTLKPPSSFWIFNCREWTVSPAVKKSVQTSRSRISDYLLSVHDSEVYKITALEAGADDFVTKPFSSGNS